MSYFVVDVESDGPVQGTHSMVCFGAVLVADTTKTFYGQTRPIGSDYQPGALAVSGFSRKEHETFEYPSLVMQQFTDWIKEVNINGNPVLISDNNGYDAAWMNWYFHHFLGKNPFGWSSRRIGDMFCGFYNDPKYRWKKHRKTKHSHNPVDDAMGNAEALHYLKSQGFKITF